MFLEKDGSWLLAPDETRMAWAVLTMASLFIDTEPTDLQIKAAAAFTRVAEQIEVESEKFSHGLMIDPILVEAIEDGRELAAINILDAKTTLNRLVSLDEAVEIETDEELQQIALERLRRSGSEVVEIVAKIIELEPALLELADRFDSAQTNLN